MALLITAYALVTAGRLHGPGLAFQLMNLFGGGFLMVNSAYYGAWPSAALNLVLGGHRPGRPVPGPAPGRDLSGGGGLRPAPRCRRRAEAPAAPTWRRHRPHARVRRPGGGR